MSKIRAFVLAFLVSMFAFFAGCDDDDQSEEEPQAGQEVECVVSEEESCEEDEPEDMEPVEEPEDMDVPEESEEEGSTEETDDSSSEEEPG